MSAVRKLSLTAILCLSLVMIFIALIRLIGTITESQTDGNKAAPVWVIYWSMVEGCVSLTMTSVIVIRAVFIAKGTQKEKRSYHIPWPRAGRRLLSTLKLPGSFPSSKQSSPRHSGDSKNVDSKPPRVSTQLPTHNTFHSGNQFVASGDERHQKLNDAEGDSDRGYYRLHDLEYNFI